MSTLAVLQARMTSTRLPGKVMRPILGEPMLSRQLERIARSSMIDGIVVATSIHPSDDEVAALAESLDVDVVRGSLDDVLQRYALAVEVYEPDVVVRLTADCPLASPEVIDAVIDRFMSADVDYCSNTLTPTFPDGLDVEVVRAQVLLAVARLSTDSAEREHATLGVYRRPAMFRLDSFESGVDLSGLRWTVDTANDLAFVREVYAALYPVNPAFEMRDVLALLDRRPELNRTAADGVRNAALVGLDTGAMNA